MMPTSPDGISSRPQLSPQDINSGGGGGADPTFAGVEFVPAAAGSMTSKLVSALREDANQKVREREACLTCFRDLLFPPESTCSPEAGESTPTIISPEPSYGPGIREVQASIASLREASLLVVEAVHAWREAKIGEIREANTKSGFVEDDVPIASFQDVGGGRGAPTTASGGLPIVQLDQIALTTQGMDPPIFLWFPPAGGLQAEDYEPRRSVQDSAPKGVGCDLRNAPATSRTARNTGERDAGFADCAPLALEPRYENSGVGGGGGGEGGSGGGSDGQTPAVAGINYLARMATDTDFAGQSGSALIDFFPPDSKLYRNPFILGHNLDDTLKVFSGTISQGGKPGGDGEGLCAGEGSSSSTSIRGVDTQRVRLAAATIIAEDARERAKNNGIKAFFDAEAFFEAGVREKGSVRSEEERALSGAEMDMEGVAEGRRLGGGAPGSSSFDDGRKRGSPRRSREGGVLFGNNIEDLQVSDGWPQGGEDFPSTRKTERGAHHPGRLKPGKKTNSTASLLAVDDGGGGGDARKPGRLDERGAVGFRDVSEGKGVHHRGRHDRHDNDRQAHHGEGGWATALKATKEKTYTGPWVPVLLNTNVSCPEGISEVLTEDDVSWQITKGDRIRIGSCAGHEWKVEGVIIVPNGKGKCRVVLSEPYKHAKAIGETPRSRLQRVATSQHLHQPPHHSEIGWSSPYTAGIGERGEGGGSSRRTGGHGTTDGVVGGDEARLARGGGGRKQLVQHDRSGVRTAPSQGSRSTTTTGPTTTGSGTTPHAPRLSFSSSTSFLPSLHRSNNMPGSLQTTLQHANSIMSGRPETSPHVTASVGGSARAKTAEGPRNRTRPMSQLLATADTGGSRLPATMAPVSTPSSSAGGKRKPIDDGKVRRGGARSALGGRGKSGKNFNGKRGVGMKRKEEEQETPEQRAARNLEIFENNLASLSLPEDVVGKGAAGGRRRSLLGGYKAHAEAVRESCQHYSSERYRNGRPADSSSRDVSRHAAAFAHDDKNSLAGENSRIYRTGASGRRASGMAVESERMPGAEHPGGKRRETGSLGGGGGLAKCQRVWKMVPQSRDTRPTWLRQYEEGLIEYGSHYQGSLGRSKKEVHFRVRLSWAELELIVKDRPHTRRFADFRPQQRFTFFRKLRLHDLLAIAYEKTSASSGGNAGHAGNTGHVGSEKIPTGGVAGGGGYQQGPELDIKSWHKFVVSLGYISDVSQPARHHDIDQMYRQRTNQYKVELSRMEAQAAKERERLLAEEKAHARRMAAAGETGKEDQHNVKTQARPDSRSARQGSTRATASGKRGVPTALSTAGNGSRPMSKGRREGRVVEQQRCKTADNATPGARDRASNGTSNAGAHRRKTYLTADAGSRGLGAERPGSGVATDSVRAHQQVVMKHVLDQDLRMDLAGFKDALRALTCLKHPEAEHKDGDEPLRDLFFNYILISPDLEGVREMAWLQAKGSAIRAEAPLQCAAVRIQAVRRGKRQLRTYCRQQAACLLIHTWTRMVVKRSQYRAELRRLEALRIAAQRRAASTLIQKWFRRIAWLWRFGIACEARLTETLRRLREWRAAKRRKRRRKEEALVFRQLRNLNGCTVLVSMSRKNPRGLDMHVRAYVPVTQETFRFVIMEKALSAQICSAFKTESLSGTEVLENLELVAARLSCRKQRDGHRWVVSRAKRVPAESGSLVFRVARRLDGVIYFLKVYRSPTDVAVTAYEPKRCETIRTVIPIRGTRGVCAWIQWEVEVGTARRRRELSRRLREAQKILKLHRMNVEVPRPALVAARRLGSAILRHNSTLPAEPDEATAIMNVTANAKPYLVDRSNTPLLLEGGVNRTTTSASPPAAATAAATVAVEATAEHATTLMDAPPLQAELSGMGPLPFTWYEGSVADLNIFGEEPLEIDEVASAPDIDITARGREATLAQWILRRVKVDTVRVVKAYLPGDGDGGCRDGSNAMLKASKTVTSWKRVLMTFFEVETIKRDVAASRIQGLSSMRRARDRARALVLAQFEKRFDIYSGTFYYHSHRSGVDTFVKPRVLREDQDVEEPTDEWIARKDRSGKRFYTNAATGQKSWLSVPEAAAVIVRACRRFLRTLYGLLGHEQIERGLRFSREAEEAWKNGGGRLASTLNYALVLHTHRHDLDAAGALYDTALKLSGENPLVQRTCGLFLLASCRFPREESRRKALTLLSAADYRDRDLDTFALAEGAFYHFGLLSRPTHSRALLNWALVLEHVRRDPDKAEFFYRRALAVNDLDPLVLVNFRSFCVDRIPGGAYPGGGPGSKVLRRSRQEDQSEDDGGWKRYHDPEASDGCLATFWFHPVLQEISWRGPQMEEANG